jgi:hypothetical protein
MHGSRKRARPVLTLASLRRVPVVEVVPREFHCIDEKRVAEAALKTRSRDNQCPLRWPFLFP